MASDAVLLEQVGDTVVLGQAERTLVKFAPIPPGRSYVISAKGNIFASNSRSTVTLEAFGAKDSVEIGFSEKQGQASFSLVVGVSLPPDEDLFTEAKVSGSSKPFVGGPETGLAVIKGVKLVVLAVDSVTVNQVQT
jgi:hypothetical protein